MRFTSTRRAAIALTLLAAPALADEPQTNPQIDYSGFAALVRDLGPVREAHRLPWNEFAARAASGEAILLDTRSAEAYRRGHLEGAVNLPFSDFTADKLRAVLGEDTGRPIYIYCNNNFTDDVAPVLLKSAPLALNIPTFINLHGYGYGNVWELADRISIDNPGIGWVSGQAGG